MASVATFDETMVDIVYELDDREIHNDIRSEIIVSDTETIEDVEEEYGYNTVWASYMGLINPGESTYINMDAEVGHVPVSWKSISVSYVRAKDYSVDEATCEASGGNWNSYGLWCGVDYGGHISKSFDNKQDSWCKVKLTNTGTLICHQFTVGARYKYLDVPGSSHEETVYNTLTVRATDPASIQKYARRVLNLTWPLGATQAQTQEIAESYKNKYSEPVSRVTMWVTGKTDALKVQILTRKVSDLITAISSKLGLSADYYINRIDYKDFADRLPQVVWTLEEQRASEAAGIFVIDTSDIDGTAWIG